MEGWSQDSRVGGRGVHVSSQPGHLLGAGGRLWIPKRKGGISALPGRTWEGRGGRKMEVGQDWHP